MSDCCDHEHPDHSQELPRLNRAMGQLEGVRKMIAERRYCPDILTQVRAARSALLSLESAILQAHLESCVTDAFNSGDSEKKTEKINELVELFRRFD